MISMENEFKQIDDLLKKALPEAEEKSKVELKKDLNSIYALAEKDQSMLSSMPQFYKVAAAIIFAALSFVSLYQFTGQKDDFPGANTGSYNLVADYGDTLILYDDEMSDAGNYELDYNMLSEIVYVDGAGRR